jgi:hypothetical protein
MLPSSTARLLEFFDMEILRDEEASSYLARTYGVQRKAKTLRKLRVVGGGPRFQVFAGRFSGYPRPELDKWVAGKLGVVSSTSEIAIGSGAEE